MKSLRQHANDFFSTSISNVTKKMSFLLREHVDLSKMVVHENIQYGDHISHVCDIWHLKKRPLPQPTILYIHGGGFRRLNKDIMWPMSYQFANLGFTVCSMNYRLAPDFPCPSALVDAQKAYLWWVDNVPRYGGSIDRITVAGESAGANLACGLALATCRPFPLLEDLFYRGKRPSSILAICPFIEIEVNKRKTRNQNKTYPLQNNLVFEQFLRNIESQYQPNKHPLGSILHSFSHSEPYFHKMPNFYIAGGKKDPVFLDSIDLYQTLQEKNIRSELHTYPAGHNFQTYLWLKQSQIFWKDLEKYFKKQSFSNKNF